ncbi:MAG TPA: SUF system NifU family Fe-S cluster assembly protein [Planctomycetaceae bacterium]|nr:SUF system NifU family Fe-S cluster assembly protein [Planctomycetaceae bacterium]HCK54226.1 SUF system NifU family Fe-S cluster assembly protein [Planctomycetaceae bacterium]
MSDELYDELILDHYESPYHRGQLEAPSCTHTERNPLCGDRVQLQLQIDSENRIQQAFFDGEGCAISQAAASILCEHIEGMTLSEIEAFDAPAMLDLLQVQLTAVRQRCGLLGFKVLKTLVYSQDAATGAST